MLSLISQSTWIVLSQWDNVPGWHTLLGLWNQIYWLRPPLFSWSHNCSDKTQYPILQCDCSQEGCWNHLARPEHPLLVWFSWALGSYSPVYPHLWCHLDCRLGIAVVDSHTVKPLFLASWTWKSQGWQITITFKGRDSWSSKFCFYVHQSKEKWL